MGGARQQVPDLASWWCPCPVPPLSLGPSRVAAAFVRGVPAGELGEVCCADVAAPWWVLLARSTTARDVRSCDQLSWIACLHGSFSDINL